jgi:hypothetical protein
MKTKSIDIAVIIALALGLILLNEFGYMQEYTKFAFIPMLSLYYLGRYVEQKIGKSKS